MSLEWKIGIGVTVIVFATIGLCFWDDATCLERGPAQTDYVWVSTGNGMGYVTPITTHPCIRRKP